MFCGFSKFLQKLKCHKPPGVMVGPTKNLDPIGSAVLTFLRYKQSFYLNAKNAKILNCKKNNMNYIYGSMHIRQKRVYNV